MPKDFIIPMSPILVERFRLDGYSTACLRQLNGVKNDNGRTLDLCFVSDEMCAHCNITRAPSMLVKVCRHHPPLQLSIKTNTKFAFEDAEVSTLFYDFGSADFDSMNSFLMNVHWAEVLRDCDADRSASIVSNILLYAIDQYVPKKLNRVIAHPAWSNSHLKRLKREKRKALRKFSKHKTPSSRARYLRANQHYKRLNGKLFLAHQERLQRRLKSNPKSFWRYVSDQRKETGLPRSMTNGMLEASSTEEIAELFLVQFSNVFSNPSTSSRDIMDAAASVPVYSAVGPHHLITDEMVLSAAKRLKKSTGCGPDGIPSVVLKQCINAISSPLTLIFNSSLETGLFPSCWKESFVFPVHKKGCKRNVSNYRGIASLCATSKLFELIVLDFLSSKCSHYISSDQHGFVAIRSTNIAVCI